MPPRSVPRKPSAAQVNAAAPGIPAAVHPAKLAASSSNAVASLFDAYLRGTPARLKLIDAFLVFTMLSGIACFAYCVLITDFPMNAFLGAFASCVGQFVLLASLRSQANPENRSDFKAVSPERAFADFAFASIILHFFSFNFLG